MDYLIGALIATAFMGAFLAIVLLSQPKTEYLPICAEGPTIECAENAK